jgi:FAD:protein FMN transferase
MTTTTPATASTVLAQTKAMATTVTVHGLVETPAARQAARAALEVFDEVELACTRFDPHSPLMRVNERPDHWHEVPRVLFRAVQESHRAHQRTKGVFDPRVLRDLVELGYDRSLDFASGRVERPAAPPGRRRDEPWRPRFRGGPHPEVLVGPWPLDLGGIGKGLALRWAAERLAREMDEFLIDAGGDIVCRGHGPDGEGWRVAVEDPRGESLPVAVLALHDEACATSSIRLRRWRADGRAVHHLVDPRTGRPGGAGLLAVTVVAADPADAEVMTKTLFLAGRAHVAAEASRLVAAALWVCTGGQSAESSHLGPRVVWSAR